jgi:hypothetical protein
MNKRESQTDWKRVKAISLSPADRIPLFAPQPNCYYGAHHKTHYATGLQEAPL